MKLQMKNKFNYTNSFQYIDLVTSNLAEFSYFGDLSIQFFFFVSYTGSHIIYKEFQGFLNLILLSFVCLV